MWHAHPLLAARRLHTCCCEQLLDYLVCSNSSDGALTGAATPNEVSTLRAADAWDGVFCESDILGTLAPSAPGTAHALTDHNIVTAAFALPAAGGGGGAATATAAFEAAVAAWREPSGAQEARLEIRRDSLSFAETR